MQMFLPPLSVVCTSKGKRFLSREKIFLRVDHFSEGLDVQERKQETTKVVFPVNGGGVRIYQMNPFPLKYKYTMATTG